MRTKTDSTGWLDQSPSDVPGTPSADVVRKALSDSHARLQSYLNRRLRNAEDARDVMQAFMLRAIDRAGSLREVEAVHGWLSRLLATSIADHQRAAARRRLREVVMSPEYFDDSPSEVAERDAVICACLHELLAILPPDHAEVIRRIDLNDEPRASVAADLGLSMATLGVRLHRARHALKQRLLEMCLTCPEHGFLDCGCETARRSELLRAVADEKSPDVTRSRPERL